jgi:serine/threonine-protein kinase HipA
VRFFVCLFNPGRTPPHAEPARAVASGGSRAGLRGSDLIAAPRRFGAQPETDVPRLYRQMVFNAMIGNTDDHLKNFWLLHDEHGYTLSPAFDLLPNIGALREHMLLFDLSPHPPGPVGLVALGRKWEISGAAAIREEVKSAMARFTEIAANYAVAEAEAERFAKDIARRLSNRTNTP